MSADAPAGSANRDHVTGENYVSLFDRLIVLGEQLPASHVIAESRVGRLVSAMVHYAEHGVDLLDAADHAADTARRELQMPVGQRTAATDVPALLNAGYPDAGGDPAASRDLELEQLRAQLQAFNDRLTNAEQVKPEPDVDPATGEPYQPPTAPAATTSVDVQPAPAAAAAGTPPAGEPSATPAGGAAAPAGAPLPAGEQPPAGQPVNPADPTIPPAQPFPGADTP